MCKINFKTNVGAEEIRIPLLLRYLHPRLGLASYLGCKNDPLFLYKSTTVCESCYLAYAEFATLVLRNGDDIMKPARVDPLNSHHSLGFKTTTRPTSADWHAMSSSHKAKNRHEDSAQWLEDHRRIMSNSIGLRTSSSVFAHHPELPPTISSPAGVLGVANNLKSTLIDKLMTVSVSSPELRGLCNKYTQEDIDTSIVARERAFFNEISKNPRLRDHHPLMHLISSQQMLKEANRSIATTEAGSHQEGIFGSTYGHQSGDKHQKYSSYRAELPYNINGVIIKPSKMAKIRRKDAERKRRMLKHSVDYGGSHHLEAASSTSSHTASSSVHKHAEFLDSMLSKINTDFAAIAH